MIVDKPKQNGIVIDLTGPQGNAFYLIGTAKKLWKQLGHTKEDVESNIKRMTSGDYDNLINYFDSEFGDYVTLYR
jgi:hypothetical protein